MEIQVTTENRISPFFSCLAACLLSLLGLSVFLTSSHVGRVMADPTSGDEAFLIVQDNDGERWSELKELNVFANVKFDGKSIVAPGSEGSYDFTVQNIADFPLKYEIAFEEENQNGVPLKFRLKEDGGYLTEDWKSAAELADVMQELTNNSKIKYTLEWRWDLNSGSKYDTAVGSKNDDTPYVLKISYTAEQNGEAVDLPWSDDKTPHTGSSGSMPFWLALMLCFGMTLFLMLFLWRKDDDEEDITLPSLTVAGLDAVDIEVEPVEPGYNRQEINGFEVGQYQVIIYAFTIKNSSDVPITCGLDFWAHIKESGNLDDQLDGTTVLLCVGEDMDTLAEVDLTITDSTFCLFE